MEDCFRHRYRKYEFLGGFLNNKSRWTSTSRYTTQLHVYQPTTFFRALYVLLFRIKPLVKALVRPFMRSLAQPRTARARASSKAGRVKATGTLATTLALLVFVRLRCFFGRGRGVLVNCDPSAWLSTS